MIHDPSYEDLMVPSLRFIASGNTYAHREELRSWAWHWDQGRRVWLNENETSPDCLAIKAIAALPGVQVLCEGPIDTAEAAGE